MRTRLSGRRLLLKPTRSQRKHMIDLAFKTNQVRNHMVYLYKAARKGWVNNYIEESVKRLSNLNRSEKGYFLNDVAMYQLLTRLSSVGTVFLPSFKDENKVETRDFSFGTDCPKFIYNRISEDLYKAQKPYKKGGKVRTRGFLKMKSFVDSRPSIPVRTDRYNGRSNVYLKNVIGNSHYIQIPTIGAVKLARGWEERVPDLNCDKWNARVVQEGSKWFLTFSVEEEVKQLRPLGKVIGVDLNLKEIAVTSENMRFESVAYTRKFNKLERQNRRVQRKISRAKNKNGNVQSNNVRKLRRKRQNLERRLTNQRLNQAFSIAADLVRDQEVSHIVLEDLQVKNMMKNRYLARSLANASFFQKRQAVINKAEKVGVSVILVNPAYTSKTCSNCGYIKYNLTLSDRTYECLNCGIVLDRDFNAAVNIRSKSIKGDVTVGMLLPEQYKIKPQDCYTNFSTDLGKESRMNGEENRVFLS